MKDRQLAALERLLAATEETNRHLVAVRKMLSEMDPDPMGKKTGAADAVVAGAEAKLSKIMTKNGPVDLG